MEQVSRARLASDEGIISYKLTAKTISHAGTSCSRKPNPAATTLGDITLPRSTTSTVVCLWCQVIETFLDRLAPPDNTRTKS